MVIGELILNRTPRLTEFEKNKFKFNIELNGLLVKRIIMTVGDKTNVVKPGAMAGCTGKIDGARGEFIIYTPDGERDMIMYMASLPKAFRTQENINAMSKALSETHVHPRDLLAFIAL